MTNRSVLDFFRGDGIRSKPVKIASLVLNDKAFAAQTDPAGYRLTGEDNEAVVAAINVSLVLRSPLLVSGEPGSGKTQLAYAIAHELGRPRPLKFVAKSTSTARDLLYHYDAVQHFRAVQTQARVDPRDFIEYSALGLAMLAGLPLEARRRFLSPGVFDRKQDAAASADRREVLSLLRARTPQQLVLLIDEIDKAPRDFPNDLLSEIETMSFSVPELGGLESLPLPPGLRPIVVVTTNSERPLPDAFVRRCVYTHLQYPREEALEEVLTSRLTGTFATGAPLVRDTRAFFEFVREQRTLHKDPGLAELIQFLQALAALGADPSQGIQAQGALAAMAVPVLGKSNEDQERLKALLQAWSPAKGR